MTYEVNKYGNKIIDNDEKLLIWGPKYHDYVGRGRESFLSCVICGRDTSKKGHSQGVVVGGGGSYIIAQGLNEAEFNDGGWMGWFPVGSECIKVIPAEFRFANPYDDKVKGTGGWNA